MTEDKKQPETPEELVARIQEECPEGGSYIYRGTNRRFCKVSSSIYRNYKKHKIFRKKFDPDNIEQDIVEQAKEHFQSNASNAEILTDLRHFGGETTLIDFSFKLPVALFFACNGEPKKDGELIALQTDGVMKLQEIDYESRSLEIALLHPSRTCRSEARAKAQGSIFVHAPRGYIPKCQYKKFRVRSGWKKEILDHLLEFPCSIYEDTIYNDLIGFIQNRENLKKSMVFFYKGHERHENEEYKDAIKYYDKSIDAAPNHAHPYNNRGAAKAKLGCFEDAIEDYSEAIRLKPDYAELYFQRGRAHRNMKNYNKARKDFEKAIELAQEQGNSRLVFNANLQLQRLPDSPNR